MSNSRNTRDRRDIIVTNMSTMEVETVCQNAKFGDAINIINCLNEQLPKESNLLYSIKDKLTLF